MTLPVTSGALRVIQIAYTDGSDDYLEHIMGHRTTKTKLVAISEAIDSAKATLSEEEIAQLKADFEGDAC